MKKILSLFTFLTISSLVVYGAGFTLDKCLTERPNSEVIASWVRSNTVPAIAQLPNESAVLGAVTGAPASPTSSISIESTLNCQKAAYYGYSIVNFLMQNNIDYTFDNRARLASEYGITNYHGYPDQNEKLLDYLRQAEVKKCLVSSQ